MSEPVVTSKATQERELLLKWNGWGYSQTRFIVNSFGQVEFRGSGNRYDDFSGKTLPNLVSWMTENLGVDLNFKTFAKEKAELMIPPAFENPGFTSFLLAAGIEHSDDAFVRLGRSHGQTVYEVMSLRDGKMPRLPDVVVWPRSAAEVEQVVATADALKCCIIPFGGGTSVSNALSCPHSEIRTIVSLDLAKMNRLLLVDKKNYVARAEAGIVGQDLEKQLNALGFTAGHEPDSVEFSTLGGWVATRASGMKKNKYGNIEDLVIHVILVTPSGLLERTCQVPRLSAGPDIMQLILGSEGILGVITEVTMKIFPIPACKKFGSLLFPSFVHGVQCLREIAAKKCAPASIRLMDNAQFRFGQALRPQTPFLHKLFDRVKKAYVLSWKGFDPLEMCAATLLFEGTYEEVAAQESLISVIARKHQAISAGSETGRFGYLLTFAIAYLRDLGFEYSVLGESFETSVPWDRVSILCQNVKALLHRESKRLGIKYPIYASCRLAQVYDTGACLYFYFGFNYRGLHDPLQIFEDIENKARDEILSCGGSISHHHGVGKLRKKWLPSTVTVNGISVLRAVKRTLDPNNTFGCGNLLSSSNL